MTKEKPPDRLTKGFPTRTHASHWPSTIWEAVRTAREGLPKDRKEARDRLALLYYKPVHRFFGRVLRVRDQRLEDVTQDFFTRFLDEKFFLNIKVEKSLRNFLKLVCRRHYLNFCRAEKVRRPRDGKVEHGLTSPTGSQIDVAVPENKFFDMMDEEIRTEYIDTAIEIVRNALIKDGKEAYWKVFEARVRFDGQKPKDYEAIAGELGRTVVDVRNYLTTARKLFRDALLEVASEHSEDPETELSELSLLR